MRRLYVFVCTNKIEPSLTIVFLIGIIAKID